MNEENKTPQERLDETNAMENERNADNAAPVREAQEEARTEAEARR